MKPTGAIFSPTRRHRYLLWRLWNGSEPHRMCNFVMLNPSIATAEISDPTVTRCMARAHDMGYDGAFVTNIFALVSTDPAALYAHHDPIGHGNDAAIVKAAKISQLVIAGWGNHGAHLDRGNQVLALLRKNGIVPHALRMTNARQPSHPLYLPYNLLPTPI